MPTFPISLVYLHEFKNDRYNNLLHNHTFQISKKKNFKNEDNRIKDVDKPNTAK